MSSLRAEAALHQGNFPSLDERGMIHGAMPESW